MPQLTISRIRAGGLGETSASLRLFHETAVPPQRIPIARLHELRNNNEAWVTERTAIMATRQLSNPTLLCPPRNDLTKTEHATSNL